MPLKIKFFLWQVFNNKLQVAQSLLKRGWKGDGHCCFCGELETVDHIFFQCHLARLKEIFPGISFPKSLMDFSETWLQGKGPLSLCLIMFVFTCFSWLWTSRNKMTIEKKFPKAPTNIIYVALSLMQKWSILLKEADREKLLHIKDAIMMSWMEKFTPSTMVVTDVCEI